MTLPRAKDLLTTYLFVAPAILLFVVFSLFPFLKVFQLSVFECDGISPDMKFVWMENFRQVFQDKPRRISMRNAGAIPALALTVHNVLSLILAMIGARDIPGK